MAMPTISFSEDKGQIYLHCLPVAGQNPIDIPTLQNLLLEKNLSSCNIDLIAIETAVNDCNTRTEPFQLPIGRRIDAEVTVHIAGDEMSAEISITPAQGGKKLVAADVVRALHDAGVVHGVNPSAIAAAITQDSCNHLLVAVGTEVVHGCNSSFELLINLGGSQTPVPDAEGHIDYREHIGISLVEPDTPLVRRTPVTPGKDGTTVKGKTIAAKEGRDDPFPADLQGTKISAEDPNLLVATIAGHPVAQGLGVYVDPLIRVPEVNLATGHITFNGAVQVDGDVTQGMKIKAKGNVVISGVVEASSIQTEGDILIKGGIIAHAQLVAGGMVVARFAEGAAIVAGKGIVIEEMALECHLQAQDDILVGLKVPQRGRLVGGIAKSLHLIKAPFIGSDKGGLTRVIVGVHESLESQYRALQFELAEKQGNEDNLRKIVQQLTKTGDPKKMLDRVKATLREAFKSTLAVQERINMLDEQLNHLRKSKVECTQGTSGTLEVTIANHKVRLTKEYGRGSFTLSDESRIMHTDPKGFVGLAT